MSDTLDLIDASGIDNMKDTEDNLLPFIEDDEPLPNKQDVGFEKYDNDIPDSNKQTIGMTILFLVLMILYLGFCVYYRKVIKTRQAVDERRLVNGDRDNVGRIRYAIYFLLVLYVWLRFWFWAQDMYYGAYDMLTFCILYMI